ncbi:protein of unknown function [Trichlorobacter ammonificans]|uniref:Uncharacterized protein n=1 Tax=Trichlorobacter ammonificans TaxID=2916410 RepID=A0ABN8HHI8_9BACT|nr:protein of unknown function [Trichlorobacter ammonificans]
MDAVKVDITAKKSEYEWICSWDTFWLNATPRIFDWLRWAITLAAIQFVATKTHSVVAYTLLAISFMAMFNYYIAFFWQIKFIGFSWPKTSNGQRILSGAISCVIGYATYSIIKLMVSAVVSSQP